MMSPATAWPALPETEESQADQGEEERCGDCHLPPSPAEGRGADQPAAHPSGEGAEEGAGGRFAELEQGVTGQQTPATRPPLLATSPVSRGTSPFHLNKAGPPGVSLRRSSERTPERHLDQ